MSSRIPEALYAISSRLTVHEALSGIFGSVSLATWIFLLVPQLILNYKTGSAEGISLAFLCVWLVGDITNLSGAIWADLVPTVIALAIYFCIADFALIGQVLYYRSLVARARSSSIASTANEQEPLLSRRRSSDTVGLPGSHRRNSSPHSATNHRRDSLTQILEEDSGDGSAWLRNAISILAVVAAGVAGWAIAWQSGVWKPSPDEGEIPMASKDALGANILGYTSAVCYLGARIPQIIKNYREKSCEGLALLFFILSLVGNATYGASILFHSLDKDYILTNLPWLIGSLGTMVEDAVIFAQFRIYALNTTTRPIEE